MNDYSLFSYKSKSLVEWNEINIKLTQKKTLTFGYFGRAKKEKLGLLKNLTQDGMIIP